MGEPDPRPPFNSARVGPFEVSLLPEYADLSRSLPLPASSSIHYSGNGWSVRTVEHRPERRGGWVQTAVARTHATNVNSVLAREPTTDGGVWDLAQILTFLNGRPIAVGYPPEDQEPRFFGDRTCHPIETLHAAGRAWESRQAIVDRQLTYALLLQNLAFQQSNLQVMAGLYTTAFNIVHDDWLRQNRARLADLSDQAKSALKDSVAAALGAIAELSADDRDSYTRSLAAAIDRGRFSALDVTIAMLVDWEVLPHDPTPQFLQRIRSLNAVRNKFVHTGQVWQFKNRPDLSLPYAIFLIRGVTCGLVQLALGRAFGFDRRGLGSFCLHTEGFTDFFRNGIWNGIPIESISYEDWLEQQATDDSP
jgi:hypothetical protein